MKTAVIKFLLFLIAVVSVAAILAIVLHFSGFLHGIGVEPRSPSTAYNFWSGFGSDLGEYSVAIALTAGLAHSIRRHNCREHGCWRIGLHTYVDKDGQPHLACKHHHPLMGKGHRIHFHELHRQKKEAEALAQTGMQNV